MRNIDKGPSVALVLVRGVRIDGEGRPAGATVQVPPALAAALRNDGKAIDLAEHEARQAAGKAARKAAGKAASKAPGEGAGEGAGFGDDPDRG